MATLKKAKIVHLTSVHRPFDIRIFVKECRALAEAGYDVVLIAPHEHEVVVDGVHIRGVPNPDSRWTRMTRTAWQIYRVALAENAQLYHFHDPELIPVGMLLKLHGKKVVYDVHEDVPRQILGKYWIPRWMRGLIAKATEIVETVGARVFDGIVTATPAIAKRFPSEKTVSVQNFPIPGELRSAEPHPYAERPNLAIYIGGIEANRGIREMVQAMTMLSETLDARLLLAGSFDPPELEKEVGQMPGWKYVDFAGWKSREEVGELLGRARVGIVALYPAPNYIEAHPIKLYEYMSVGIPVVASDFPLWREIVEGSGCGILVDPLDPSNMANAMAWLLDHPQEAEVMGKCGQEAVRTRYNWPAQAAKLKSFYQLLLDEKKDIPQIALGHTP